jgi:hypothetical protein
MDIDVSLTSEFEKRDIAKKKENGGGGFPS